MDYLRRDLTKQDLVHMIKGCPPSHEMYDYFPGIRKFWEYTGGFVDGFAPRYYDGRDETLEELNLIYGACKAHLQ